MKKLILKVLIGILFINTGATLLAQTNQLMNENGEYLIDKEGIISGVENESCCGEETLGDISFGYNINAALFSHSLIAAARKKTLNEWFKRQNNLIKEEIEKQLNQNFSNFSDAQTAYFKKLEYTNVKRNISTPIGKYKSKEKLRNEIRDNSIRDLKLLELRENEIKAGLINNSNYGHLKINNTPLYQITSLSQLETLRVSAISNFGKADYDYNYDNNILLKLKEILQLNNYNTNHDIITRLKDKQVEYYNSYDRWEQLDLMQLYLNNVRVPMVMIVEIQPVDFTNSSFIENYGINFSSKGWGPFSPDACPPIRVFIPRIGWDERPNTACFAMNDIRKQEVIDEAVGTYSESVLIQDNISQYVNNIENPLTGKPIELYLIAKYKNSNSLDLSIYSVSSNEIKVGEYFLKPHYDLANELVFYGAYRTDNNGNMLMDIEYVISADSLQEFQNNVSLYTYAANLFYTGGIPSQGQIAMAAGDYWSGLGSMWYDALHSEEWWAFTILSFGQAIVALPVNTTVSSMQTVPNWRNSLRNMTSKSFKGKVVTNPQGVKISLDIPDNYVPSMSNTGQGVSFKPNPPIGTHPEAGMIRVMGPTNPGVTYPYPKGYVVFYNNFGQPINPSTGQTLRLANRHFSFN